MQLDLGHLRVRNTFRWHGNPEKDASAVHLDILDAEVVTGIHLLKFVNDLMLFLFSIQILGINVTVGINGCVGKPMIREGREVKLHVRRSLRDVFRKVPTLFLEIKVISQFLFLKCVSFLSFLLSKLKLLISPSIAEAHSLVEQVASVHAVMSDREYNVILSCFCTNLCEPPNIPPSFRNSQSSAKDTIKMLAVKMNMNGQILFSRTVTIMAVEVDHALLELCYGADKESPLAHVLVSVLVEIFCFSKKGCPFSISLYCAD